MNLPNTQITEADVKAFTQRLQAFYAPLFPEIRDLHVSIDNTDKFCLHGYVGPGYETRLVIGETFEECAKKLREELGTTKSKVAKMRQEAAKLLEEADKLSELV